MAIGKAPSFGSIGGPSREGRIGNKGKHHTGDKSVTSYAVHSRVHYPTTTSSASTISTTSSTKSTTSSSSTTTTSTTAP